MNTKKEQDKEMESAAEKYAKGRKPLNAYWKAEMIDAFGAGWKAAGERKDAEVERIKYVFLKSAEEHEAEIAQLKASNACIKHDGAGMNAEITQLRFLLETSMAKNVDLQSKLAEKEADISMLQAHNSEMCNEIATSIRLLKHANDSIAARDEKLAMALEPLEFYANDGHMENPVLAFKVAREAIARIKGEK